MDDSHVVPDKMMSASVRAKKILESFLEHEYTGCGGRDIDRIYLAKQIKLAETAAYERGIDRHCSECEEKEKRAFQRGREQGYAEAKKAAENVVEGYAFIGSRMFREHAESSLVGMRMKIRSLKPSASKKTTEGLNRMTGHNNGCPCDDCEKGNQII